MPDAVFETRWRWRCKKPGVELVYVDFTAVQVGVSQFRAFVGDVFTISYSDDSVFIEKHPKWSKILPLYINWYK